MFEILISCKPEELQEHAERIAGTLDRDNAEAFIRILWKRVPELTEEQERSLHQLGRKVRKQFHMKPIREKRA